MPVRSVSPPTNTEKGLYGEQERERSRIRSFTDYGRGGGYRPSSTGNNFDNSNRGGQNNSNSTRGGYRNGRGGGSSRRGGYKGRGRDDGDSNYYYYRGDHHRGGGSTRGGRAGRRAEPELPLGAIPRRPRAPAVGPDPDFGVDLPPRPGSFYGRGVTNHRGRPVKFVPEARQAELEEQLMEQRAKRYTSASPEVNVKIKVEEEEQEEQDAEEEEEEEFGNDPATIEANIRLEEERRIKKEEEERDPVFNPNFGKPPKGSNSSDSDDDYNPPPPVKPEFQDSTGEEPLCLKKPGKKHRKLDTRQCPKFAWNGPGYLEAIAWVEKEVIPWASGYAAAGEDFLLKCEGCFFEEQIERNLKVPRDLDQLVVKVVLATVYRTFTSDPNGSWDVLSSLREMGIFDGKMETMQKAARDLKKARSDREFWRTDNKQTVRVSRYGIPQPTPTPTSEPDTKAGEAAKYNLNQHRGGGRFALGSSPLKAFNDTDPAGNTKDNSSKPSRASGNFALNASALKTFYDTDDSENYQQEYEEVPRDDVIKRPNFRPKARQADLEVFTAGLRAVNEDIAKLGGPAVDPKTGLPVSRDGGDGGVQLPRAANANAQNFNIVKGAAASGAGDTSGGSYIGDIDTPTQQRGLGYHSETPSTIQKAVLASSTLGTKHKVDAQFLDDVLAHALANMPDSPEVHPLPKSSSRKLRNLKDTQPSNVETEARAIVKQNLGGETARILSTGEAEELLGFAFANMPDSPELHPLRTQSSHKVGNSKDTQPPNVKTEARAIVKQNHGGGAPRVLSADEAEELLGFDVSEIIWDVGHGDTDSDEEDLPRSEIRRSGIDINASTGSPSKMDGSGAHTTEHTLTIKEESVKSSGARRMFGKGEDEYDVPSKADTVATGFGSGGQRDEVRLHVGELLRKPGATREELYAALEALNKVDDASTKQEQTQGDDRGNGGHAILGASMKTDGGGGFKGHFGIADGHKDSEDKKAAGANLQGDRGNNVAQVAGDRGEAASKSSIAEVKGVKHANGEDSPEEAPSNTTGATRDGPEDQEEPSTAGIPNKDVDAQDSPKEVPSKTTVATHEPSTVGISNKHAIAQDSPQEVPTSNTVSTEHQQEHGSTTGITNNNITLDELFPQIADYILLEFVPLIQDGIIAGQDQLSQWMQNSEMFVALGGSQRKVFAFLVDDLCGYIHASLSHPSDVDYASWDPTPLLNILKEKQLRRERLGHLNEKGLIHLPTNEEYDAMQPEEQERVIANQDRVYEQHYGELASTGATTEEKEENGKKNGKDGKEKGVPVRYEWEDLDMEKRLRYDDDY